MTGKPSSDKTPATAEEASEIREKRLGQLSQRLNTSLERHEAASERIQRRSDIRAEPRAEAES